MTSIGVGDQKFIQFKGSFLFRTQDPTNPKIAVFSFTKGYNFPATPKLTDFPLLALKVIIFHGAKDL